MFRDPAILYGSSISYFTGKMENYFRVKGIPYERIVSPYPAFAKKMKKTVGVHQMPAVELPDGRWMTDTTKMIQWFENEFSVIVTNNSLRNNLVINPLINILAICCVNLGWNLKKIHLKSSKKFLRVAVFYGLGLILFISASDNNILRSN